MSSKKVNRGTQLIANSVCMPDINPKIFGYGMMLLSLLRITKVYARDAPDADVVFMRKHDKTKFAMESISSQCGQHCTMMCYRAAYGFYTLCEYRSDSVQDIARKLLDYRKIRPSSAFERLMIAEGRSCCSILHEMVITAGVSYGMTEIDVSAWCKNNVNRRIGMLLHPNYHMRLRPVTHVPEAAETHRYDKHAIDDYYECPGTADISDFNNALINMRKEIYMMTHADKPELYSILRRFMHSVKLDVHPYEFPMEMDDYDDATGEDMHMSMYTIILDFLYATRYARSNAGKRAGELLESKIDPSTRGHMPFPCASLAYVRGKTPTKLRYDISTLIGRFAIIDKYLSIIWMSSMYKVDRGDNMPKIYDEHAFAKGRTEYHELIQNIRYNRAYMRDVDALNEFFAILHRTIGIFPEITDINEIVNYYVGYFESFCGFDSSWFEMGNLQPIAECYNIAIISKMSTVTIRKGNDSSEIAREVFSMKELANSINVVFAADLTKYPDLVYALERVHAAYGMFIDTSLIYSDYDSIAACVAVSGMLIRASRSE